MLSERPVKQYIRGADTDEAMRASAGGRAEFDEMHHYDYYSVHVDYDLFIW